MRLSVVKSTYLERYRQARPITLSKHFGRLRSKPWDKNGFGYSLSTASVYSAMIEGNTIDMDTYLRYASTGMNTKSKSFLEIEDLRASYMHASGKGLGKATLLEAHSIASANLVQDDRYRGSVRDRDVYIFSEGSKVYTGAPPDAVQDEFERFFRDVDILLERELTVSECFYFAAMLHLVFVKIHPFADGNGRMARLVEKWFLAEKLGANAWFIESEKLYQKRIKSYYRNLSIGDTYANTDYALSMPFLLMLPMALTAGGKP